jgi:heptosyltransferase II
MPSSQWSSKNWPVDHYLETLKNISLYPVVLGTSKDQASHDLCEGLAKLGIKHFSGVGVWNLRQTAQVIARSKGFFGGDTGLAHLAESYGIPTRVIFGPTTPEMGFGPRLAKSQSIEINLWCRPCSINGGFCYRPIEKQLCLKNLRPEQVLAAVENLENRT